MVIQLLVTTGISQKVAKHIRNLNICEKLELTPNSDSLLYIEKFVWNSLL